MARAQRTYAPRTGRASILKSCPGRVFFRPRRRRGNWAIPRDRGGGGTAGNVPAVFFSFPTP